MLKIKYLRLNKKERKNIRKEYFQTENGKNVKSRLNRLLFSIVFGYLYTIYLILDIIFNKYLLINVIMSIILFIASTFFLLSYYKVRIAKINYYLIKKK